MSALKSFFIFICFSLLTGHAVAQGNGNQLLELGVKLLKSVADEVQKNKGEIRSNATGQENIHQYNNTVSSSEYDKIVQVGTEFIQSISWPKKENKLGFKSLSIGDTLDLDNEDLVEAKYIINEIDKDVGRTAGPYLKASLQCRIIPGWPIGDCRVDPSKLKQQNLNSAFGKPVQSLTFSVVLLEIPSIENVNRNKLGKSRIASIHLEVEDIAENSKEYFSTKLKTKPKVTMINKYAYLENHIKHCKQLQRKPQHSLTMEELRISRECPMMEALLQAEKMKSKTATSTTYNWTANNYSVEVNDKKIFIGISSIKPALQIWKQKMESIKKGIDNQENKRNKEDF